MLTLVQLNLSQAPEHSPAPSWLLPPDPRATNMLTPLHHFYFFQKKTDSTWIVPGVPTSSCGSVVCVINFSLSHQRRNHYVAVVKPTHFSVEHLVYFQCSIMNKAATHSTYLSTMSYLSACLPQNKNQTRW